MNGLFRRYRNELRKRQFRQSKRSLVLDIDRELHLHFGKWLKEKVDKNDIEGITDDLRCLALGPSDKVVRSLAYNVNGFKFRAIERDDDLRTQNSGVYVNANTMSYASSHDQNPIAGDLAYYGKLVEVIELNYYETFRVVLFKCKWADTRNNRGYKQDIYGHSMVNFSRLLHAGNDDEDEPYILASQAKMVYYVEDPCEKGWDIAVHVQPRDLYQMSDSSISE